MVPAQGVAAALEVAAAASATIDPAVPFVADSRALVAVVVAVAVAAVAAVVAAAAVAAAVAAVAVAAVVVASSLGALIAADLGHEELKQAVLEEPKCNRLTPTCCPPLLLPC